MYVVDADRHLIEPFTLWGGLAPELRSYLPERAGYGLRIGGEDVWRPLLPKTERMLEAAAAARAEDIAAAASGAGHLAAMDRAGIDAAVLFPTIAHFILAIEALPAHVVADYARVYNAYVRSCCAVDDRRLFAAGVVSRHDVSAMPDAVVRLADEGFRAVVVRPNPMHGRTIAHADYEPFFAACERTGLALVVHEGSHARAPSAGADRFETRFGQHACSHPFEQMMALTGLIEGGVLERHPTLRVGFFEAGAGWLPYWLWRLDHVEYAQHRDEVREHVCRPPSQYFRRQCWVTVEPSEPGLDRVVEIVGADRLLFGTDFPHLDHDADAAPTSLDAVGPTVAGAVLTDNPRRFYRL
ncbi:MAG: amidohydrolase family protein [Deltaproteobacteria bacterium]|jgi:predicted TIM-barrel fold metal-dependent hydrolase